MKKFNSMTNLRQYSLMRKIRSYLLGREDSKEGCSGKGCPTYLLSTEERNLHDI